MKLRSVKLTNFRCFTDLTVPLDEKLTVLVGNNGAGKTTILDAIGYALARILTRMPNVGGKDFRDEDLRLERKGVFSQYLRIEAENSEGVVWSRTHKRDSSRLTAERVPEPIGDKLLYEYLDPIIYAVSEGQDAVLPVFAYYGVSRAVLDVPQRRRAFKKEFSRFQALENALEPTARFKELFEWFYVQERDHLAQLASTFNQERFKQWAKDFEEAPVGKKPPLPKFPEMSPVLGAVYRAMQIVIPGYHSPTIKTEPLRLVLKRISASGGEEEISLQMLSGGFRTMIALVMDFARRLAQANPKLPDPLAADAVLLIDEVDLHLHPKWQQTVLPALQKAFPNTQVIVTTHSPQVLTTAPFENILILEENRLFSSSVPTYGAKSSDLVRTVLGLEDLRPPDNEITRKIAALFSALDQDDLAQARSIREDLREWQKGLPEPDLTRADFLIRRLEAKRQ